MNASIKNANYNIIFTRPVIFLRKKNCDFDITIKKKPLPSFIYFFILSFRVLFLIQHAV